MFYYESKKGITVYNIVENYQHYILLGKDGEYIVLRKILSKEAQTLSICEKVYYNEKEIDITDKKEIDNLHKSKMVIIVVPLNKIFDTIDKAQNYIKEYVNF